MIPLFLMSLVTVMFSELARSAVPRRDDRPAAVAVYIGTFLFFLTMLRIAFVR